MTAQVRPVVLVVLDGWGYREDPQHNAIARARTPVWDRLWSHYPHALIEASGPAVGLPRGQMGNSEVGHLNLGAGRVVYQEYTRVARAIRTGSFFSNRTLTGAVDRAIATNRAVHVLGLLSPGGVHSHEDQVRAFVDLAVQRGAPRVYLHAFLDGRDTPPKSASGSIGLMQERLRILGTGRFASVIGRYYAMDRDHRWPRIQAAYELLTEGDAPFRAPTARAALEMAYARGETDEFVQATAIAAPGEHPVRVEDGDVVVFMNYRSDRARQITRAFVERDFAGFPRRRPLALGGFVSLTEYSADLDVPVAFPPERLPNVFGEYVAALGLRQLRIAETEKYAHVTFFFNGGREAPFRGEDRVLVPSPQVATYDLKPEMSAPEVTGRLVEAVEGGRYDVCVCNLANPDMVGHTGNLEATVAAIETVDRCLGRIEQAVRAAGGELVITADHGNAEQLLDPEAGQPHTAHTSNPVPFVYVGRPAEVEAKGGLQDVAPTLLHVLGLPQPAEMGGRSLVRIAPAR
jgi:2,3-bisphosphoglycerate-independent phosphoglycerate mutase